jgi:uncharacterized membrane protein YgdD (TMEM256/DUF423 family)
MCGFFIAMNKTLWLRLIAISGALSIMFGAFGAHGLEDRLPASYLDTSGIIGDNLFAGSPC